MMSYARESGEHLAVGVARSVGAGLAAAAVGGLLTAMLVKIQFDTPEGWGVVMVLAVAAMTALSYRHVGAMVASGTVIAAIGMFQVVTVQSMKLMNVEVSSSYSLLQGSAIVMGVGCLLLGAGAGWASLHQEGGMWGRWAQYQGLRLIGAAVAGGLATGLFVFLVPLLESTDIEHFSTVWWFLPGIGAAGLALGASLALSPAAALAPLLGLVVLQVMDSEQFWVGPLMTLGVVLLGAVAHFIGPVADPVDGAAEEAAWQAWISGDGAR